jgi:putative transposase
MIALTTTRTGSGSSRSVASCRSPRPPTTPRADPTLAARDSKLKTEIARVHGEQFGVYGARKVWRQLHREGIAVARCTVEWLMRQLGLEGVRRGKAHKTTTADPAAARPADLVERDCSATRPNQRWVADLTECGHLVRLCVCGLGDRRILPVHRGLAASRSLRTDLALDALEMAIWRRHGGLDGLVHHSDRGSQYLAIRYTERLAEPARSPRWVPVATRSITRWPRRSSGWTRPSWSAGAAPGGA